MCTYFISTVLVVCKMSDFYIQCTFQSKSKPLRVDNPTNVGIASFLYSVVDHKRYSFVSVRAWQNLSHCASNIQVISCDKSNSQTLRRPHPLWYFTQPTHALLIKPITHRHKQQHTSLFWHRAAQQVAFTCLSLPPP